MLENLELPSSKWVVSTVATVVITLVAVLDASETAGVDLPPWVYVIGGLLAPLVVYLKQENRPSSSARRATE